MSKFEGIQLKIGDDDATPLDIGIPEGELDEDTAAALVEATALVLQKHFEQPLQYLWIKIDGRKYGMADQTVITGPMIDNTIDKMRNFLAHTEALEQ